MAATTQPVVLGDLLRWECDPVYSRDTVTVTGGNYPLGTPLALVSGKFQRVDPAGTGAAKKTLAVLADPTDASSGDQAAVVIARLAIVAGDYVAWPSGITDAQKATVISDLAAAGVLVRTLV